LIDRRVSPQEGLLALACVFASWSARVVRYGGECRGARHSFCLPAESDFAEQLFFFLGLQADFSPNDYVTGNFDRRLCARRSESNRGMARAQAQRFGTAGQHETGGPAPLKPLKTGVIGRLLAGARGAGPKPASKSRCDSRPPSGRHRGAKVTAMKPEIEGTFASHS